MYETWGADLDDWEMRECSDDELIGVLYSVSGHELHPSRTAAHQSLFSIPDCAFHHEIQEVIISLSAAG